ncbi:hypothetical protein L249_4828 [Ophiocordyceps polyrhachis-furcata BCC 54312]|uniref:Amino acid permease/ SLC12A domain-containing protein n=1 Tax=Ophiocordyceps polyrhachis-furcata BCC 54312 TaxID=1330021 RepID=A0A367L328_9HYPO|nr:hypothetical protein L249_4828 [Ophiocordyceps polyrhachis-furcata BCC 54312]
MSQQHEANDSPWRIDWNPMDAQLSEPRPGPDPPRPSSSADEVFVHRTRTIDVAATPDRMVNRKLRGINLSMIAVNATLGSGLYWTGGQVLRVGGPLTAPLSFLVSGLLAWAVMQCVTEMLCIWPIPGALSVYVSEFVDFELGIAVGVAYWFTYSISFAALITTAADTIHFWVVREINWKIFDGFVIYLLTPIVLLLINSFEVGVRSLFAARPPCAHPADIDKIYGWIEVVGSSVKITCLVIVMALLGLLMNVWKNPLSFDTEVSNHWVVAFAICLSMASFAYVGVEVVAASALEAKWPEDTAEAGGEILISKTVKFSAIYIPILATIAYTLAALLASLSSGIGKCQLKHLSWIHSDDCSKETEPQESIFVHIAMNSGRSILKHVINAFIVFSTLTCANTNLYVASRTMFGLTTRLDGSKTENILLRFLSWFGKTNHRKVPIRSVVFSAAAFMWVPFLQLQNGKPIETFIEIMAKMGTTGVVIVWACECWAFIRFYNCIRRHKATLKREAVGQVQRDDVKNYPYRSHGQPFVAYAALAGCIFIIVVSNGAPLWKGFYLTPFLAFFLLPLVFLALWVLLKLMSGGRWTLVDLSNEKKVVNLMQKLHDIRQYWS